MDKKHLNDHISKMAMEIPDQPENVPFTSKKVISLTLLFDWINLPFFEWILAVK